MPGFYLTCPATFSESLECSKSRIVSELVKLYDSYSLHNWNGHEDNKSLASFKSYGVSCMSIVFCTVLSATKNLDAAVYYAKKAYLYYAEFISQISQDSNSFLKLTPTDAVLFSYKKTIFTLDRSLSTVLSVAEEELFGMLYSLTHIIGDCMDFVARKNTRIDIGEIVSRLGQQIICQKKWTVKQLLLLKSRIHLALMDAQTQKDCEAVLANTLIIT